MALCVLVLAAPACTKPTVVLDHRTTPSGQTASSARMRVRGGDRRPEVIGGALPACYVGTFNTDVNVPVRTENGPDCTPLADALVRDVVEGLRARGVDTQAEDALVLELHVQEWEYDGPHTGHAWYTVEVSLLDARHEELGNTKLQSSGKLAEPGRGSYVEALARMPALYDALVEDILAFALDASR